MKKLILFLITMFVVGELNAGWFCSEDQLWLQFDRTIQTERQSTGNWQLIAGGFAIGAPVFVCDNLSFSGEVQFARKHTRFINRDLPQLTERAIGLLLAKWHDQDKRIEAYKIREVNDEAAHDLVIRSIDVGVCANSYIPSIVNEWRNPQHTAFESRNVWSLFNAFTETLKPGEFE